MQSVLFTAFEKNGIPYYRYLKDAGHLVRVLDCFETDHRKLVRWYGAKSLLQVEGHRANVEAEVKEAGFHAALVVDGEDFVRTALIVQSLRDAGIANIIVATKDPARRLPFRRSGAHSVLVGADESNLGPDLEPLLTWNLPA